MRLRLLLLSIFPLLLFASPQRGDEAAKGIGYIDEDAWNPTAADYIQDGLVALWDGIENAGWDVHDPDAHKWVNLMGDGPDFGNSSMSFGPDYMTLGTTIYATGLSAAIRAAFTAGHDYTVQFLAEVGDTKHDNVLMFYGGRSVISFYIVLNRIYYNNAIVTYGSDLAVGENRLFTFVRKGSMGYGYFNDSLFASKEVDTTLAATTIYSYATAHRQKRIAIYNRALTDDEIRYNYLVDRLRFNLP